MIFLYVDPGSGYAFLNMGAWLFGLVLAFMGFIGLALKRLVRFIKKHRKSMIIVIAVLSLMLTIAGLLMMRQAAPFKKKIVILGIDALSPEVMEPMIEQGGLPNFALLKEKGGYRRLTTTNPAQSPVAWAGFATGKNPGKNGIFDFIVRDKKNYSMELVFSKMRNGRPQGVLKAKGFWHYTSLRKVPAVILACPDTFPAEKIYGKMLSGMGVPDILGTQGTFTFYTSADTEQRDDVGGNVFRIERSEEMIMDLIGPRVMAMDGKPRYSRVPFRLELTGNNKAVVKYQKKKIELEAGQWSGWSGVEFSLGPLKKAKGIFRFYLVETSPELKLYISPVNFDPGQPLYPISYPAGYSNELFASLGPYHTQGMPIDTWALNEDRISEKAFLQQAEKVHSERKAMLDIELGKLKEGVLFCYFGAVDTVQHVFWRDITGDGSGRDFAGHNAEIRKWYQKMDSIVGDVLGRLRPEDVLVVLSDHGFGAFQRAVHLNSWLRANGYLMLKDPEMSAGSELLTDVDWSRTKAFALGFGGIYINQKSRESKGIVKAGADTENLKRQIIHGLEQWVDEDKGARVIKKVYSREDIFTGPFAKDAPDLYIGFHKGYRASWQTAMGGAPELLLEDNHKKWSADHLFDPSLVPGVIFANKKITRETPSIYDLTPSVLKLVGYSDEEIRKFDFDGTVLF